MLPIPVRIILVVLVVLIIAVVATSIKFVRENGPIRRRAGAPDSAPHLDLSLGGDVVNCLNDHALGSDGPVGIGGGLSSPRPMWSSAWGRSTPFGPWALISRSPFWRRWPRLSL